ncbi:MAG: PH domain-containing protein, partial [Coriobacteriales bacterium]|nr:PH domain-containing protein [Coriobacteriales bacterium]
MRALPTRKLDKRITWVWRASALINTLVCAAPVVGALVAARIVLGFNAGAGAAFAAFVFNVLILVGLLLAVLALVVFVGVFPKIRWLQWRFDVLEEEIDIQKGIFWRKRIIIPLIRVQNVDTRQGPVMRAFGLASITVATAAG